MKSKALFLTAGFIGMISFANATDADLKGKNANPFIINAAEKGVKMEVINNNALKSRFHVELPDLTDSFFNVTMYDDFGRVVYESSLPQNKQNALSMDLKALPKGKYYLKIKTLNKESSSDK